MAHLAALRAFPDGPPVGVTVFVEGEEEIGSDSLLTLLERHSEKLRADAIVLADSANWAIGEPALTVTLRGPDPGRRHGHDPRPRRPLGHVRRCRPRRHHRPDPPHRHPPRRRTATSRSRASSPARRPTSTTTRQRLRLESGLLDGVQVIGTGTILDPALDQAVADDHRVQRTHRRAGPPTPSCRRRRPSSRCGSRPTRTRWRRMPLLRAHLEQHVPVGRPGGGPPRRRGPRVRRRRQRAGLRPGPRGVHRRVGRRAGRHRRGRVDPVRGAGSPRCSPRRRSS